MTETSENDDYRYHRPGTTKVVVKSHGKERRKMKALGHPQTTDIRVGTRSCRLFQVWAVATGQA